MAEREIPFELMSAYVDGELEPEEAARVARLAAEDEAVARQLALLQELRAGVAGIVPEVVVLPPRSAPAGPVPRNRLWAALAASLAAAGIALAAVLWGWGEGDGADGGPMLRLVASHDDWRGTIVEGLLPAGVAGARATALMAATGLTLVHEAVVPLEGGAEALHSGYLGANGCRVSLFELPAAGRRPMADGLKLTGADDLLTAEWAAGASYFVMIARNMDEVRFATIASSLRSAADAARTDEADLMAALEGARQRCLA